MHADQSSSAPEWFIAFLERINPADPDVFQHSIIEGEQVSALAVNRIIITQTGKHAGKNGANPRMVIDGLFRVQGCIVTHGLILHYFRVSRWIMKNAD